MKIQIIIFLLSLCLLSCNNPKKDFWPPEKSPEIISKLITNDLLSRQDFMTYDTGDVIAPHYAEVCTAFGAARIAGLLHDTTTIDHLTERYMKVINDSIINTANHVDANVYGILPLELFKYNRDSIFYKQGLKFAKDQWANELPNGLTNQTRFWIDDIWMIGSLQIQAYKITNDKIYLDRAAREIVAYLEKLQRPNGLFFHGENAPFFWGRGNGWAAAGIAEVLTVLPKDHPDYDTILKGYKKMMKTLLQYQAEDGMWRQLVDHEFAWKETSCTGMFAYAICIGVKKGILPKDGYENAYQKAWLSLTKYIGSDGKISDVCVGTGQNANINYYLERPTITGDFHGQAPVLWLAYALMK